VKEKCRFIKGNMFEVLDVGCGTNPTGTVNVDLHVGICEHRASIPFVPKEIPNFVLCDGEHLPFKDNSFDKVFSRHSLEHVGRKPQETNTGPFFMLTEMVRVAKKEVEIIVPHRFSLANAEKRFWRRRHNAFFNLKWFNRVIPKVERKLNVKLSVLVDLIFKPIIVYFVMMPSDIHITLIKRRI